MKRRRALRILGAAGAAPWVASGAGFSELLALGAEVRRGRRPGDPLEMLSEAQARALSAITDVILPETDTPSASVVGVTEFIDTLLTGWLPDAERDWFLAGLDTIDPLARRAYGVDFADCQPGDQVAIVSALDAELDRLRRDPTADETRHFFYDVKRFTLAGYFTSEPGMTALGYRIVPGAFEGCVLLDQYGTGDRR
ncbi:MAG: gluconate 2-dehydrogenase subunit 3 family protein [Gemmatimonadetes bacterium]|nr:gluconate 2-dehydrogenase subunit 3 family protein [Gemmatimonadota bacterium]